MSSCPSLAAKDLTLCHDRRAVIHSVTLTIPDGAFTAIIGPNGSGKSTLLRGLARILPPATGSVRLGGRPLSALSQRDIAQSMAVLPQRPSIATAMRVQDLVARGRTPHRRLLRPWSDADETALTEALALTRMTDLADTPLSALSGGQRQRAWIAMTLAQDTPILLLDEPTTYLDLCHQIEVLSLLRGLADRGKTIVAVLHDINLSARFADHVVALRDGRIRCVGSPDRTVTRETMRDVFGIACHVMPCPVHATPLVVPC